MKIVENFLGSETVLYLRYFLVSEPELPVDPQVIVDITLGSKVR